MSGEGAVSVLASEKKAGCNGMGEDCPEVKVKQQRVCKEPVSDVVMNVKSKKQYASESEKRSNGL